MDNIILYHGSSYQVDKPDLVHSRRDIDFGTGFYLTEDERMAKKWAAGKTLSYTNQYRLDLTELKVYRFSLDREWLEFVKNNRLMIEDNRYDLYDVLIGPTADDKLYDTLRDYLDGTMTTKETLRTLNVLGYSEQVVVRTDKGLESLRFVGAKELQKAEVAHYREIIRSERKMAGEKTLELKRQFTKERQRQEMEHDR